MATKAGPSTSTAKNATIKTDDDDYLTVADVAALVKMHPKFVYSHINNGDLPAARMGSDRLGRPTRLRVRRSDARKWLERLDEQGRAS